MNNSAKLRINIVDIIAIVKEHKIIWTNHVLVRLIQRNILQEDVENAIINGKIIEYYPDDYPTPSCLVLDLATKETYLHVV